MGNTARNIEIGEFKELFENAIKRDVVDHITERLVEYFRKEARKEVEKAIATVGVHSVKSMYSMYTMSEEVEIKIKMQD